MKVQHYCQIGVKIWFCIYAFKTWDMHFCLWNVMAWTQGCIAQTEKSFLLMQEDVKHSFDFPTQLQHLMFHPTPFQKMYWFWENLYLFLLVGIYTMRVNERVSVPQLLQHFLASHVITLYLYAHMDIQWCFSESFIWKAKC